MKYESRKPEKPKYETSNWRADRRISFLAFRAFVYRAFVIRIIAAWSSRLRGALE
jgi:hypothetical protein